jgi:flagellar biosynthesis/type III secretory pathway chaperone
VLDFMIKHFEEMIAIQTQLINCSERKKSVLIERKVKELNQIVQEEAKLVKLLAKLEEERKQLVDSALQEHPSFSQFIDALPDDPSKKKLSSLFKELQQLTMELQSKNQVNEQLLQDSVSFVQHMIDQVTHSKQRHFNYQSPLSSQPSQTSSRGFFDTKA